MIFVKSKSLTETPISAVIMVLVLIMLKNLEYCTV